MATTAHRSAVDPGHGSPRIVRQDAVRRGGRQTDERATLGHAEGEEADLPGTPARCPAPGTRAAGVLVDEQYGQHVVDRSAHDPVVLAVPIEASGHDWFILQWGEQMARARPGDRSRVCEGAGPRQSGLRREFQGDPTRESGHGQQFVAGRRVLAALRTARAGHRRATRFGRRQHGPLRRRTATGADRAGAGRQPVRRGGAGAVEGRGSGNRRRRKGCRGPGPRPVVVPPI